MEFPDSSCDVSEWIGLNDRGKRVIREMNRLGLVINVTNGSDETIRQTAQASEDPVIYTHGRLRHVIEGTRWISDEAAEAVAAKEGVIGLQFGNSSHNPRTLSGSSTGCRLRTVHSGSADPGRCRLCKSTRMSPRGCNEDRAKLGSRNVSDGRRPVGESHRRRRHPCRRRPRRPWFRV